MIALRMHYLRIWRDVEIVFVAIIFLISLYYLFKEDLIGYGLLFLLSITFLTVGTLVRTLIIKKMVLRAKRMGLKRIGLLKYKEDEKTVQYEVHVLVPDKPLGNDIEKVKHRILREFIHDISLLERFAKQHEKDVEFFGTSHKTFTEAWINTWRKRGIECKTNIKNMDPLAGSKRDWKKMIAKFYGRKIYMSYPPKTEWITTSTKVIKER